MTTSSPGDWIPTRAMAAELGVTPDSLRRAPLFKEGIHWRRTVPFSLAPERCYREWNRQATLQSVADLQRARRRQEPSRPMPVLVGAA